MHDMRPVSKWVDDHIFFRVKKEYVSSYNKMREECRKDIKKEGGKMQKEGQIWYQEKKDSDDKAEEYNEDMSSQI